MAKRFNICMSVLAVGTCMIIGFQLFHAPAAASSQDGAQIQSAQPKLTGPSKTVLEY